MGVASPSVAAQSTIPPSPYKEPKGIEVPQVAASGDLVLQTRQVLEHLEQERMRINEKISKIESARAALEAALKSKAAALDAEAAAKDVLMEALASYNDAVRAPAFI